MADDCDLMLVIGSRNSSNSVRLVEVARDCGTDAHLIDNAGEVREEWLKDRRVVGISSGASAPENLVQELVDFFRARGCAGHLRVPRDPRGRPLHAPQADPTSPADGRESRLNDQAFAPRAQPRWPRAPDQRADLLSTRGQGPCTSRPHRGCPTGPSGLRPL